LVLVELAVAAALGAILVLRSGWRNARTTWVRRGVAALLVAVSASLWIASAGAEIGIPLLLETLALLAFAFIPSRIEREPERAIPIRALSTPSQHSASAS